MLAWENSRQSGTLPLVSPPNDVWEKSAEIPYWWLVTIQIWVVPLIGWIKFPTRHDQASSIQVEDVPAILYQQINGEMARQAALRTKGSCGPSGVDANGFKRILACKSFKKSSMNLCDSLATLARRLCTEFVDPLTIELILVSRLIPLDKGKGDVKPIGVSSMRRVNLNLKEMDFDIERGLLGR